MLGSSEAAVTVARSSVADLELTTDELEMRESETESSKAPPDMKTCRSMRTCLSRAVLRWLRGTTPGQSEREEEHCRKEGARRRPQTKSRQNSEMSGHPQSPCKRHSSPTAPQFKGHSRTTRKSAADRISHREPHAVCGGCDTGNLANRPDRENSIQSSSSAKHVVVNYLSVERMHFPRTNNHEVAQL